MTEPCTLTRHSFIGWIKWVKENRLTIRCYVLETNIKSAIVTEYRGTKNLGYIIKY